MKNVNKTFLAPTLADNFSINIKNITPIEAAVNMNGNMIRTIETG